MAGDPDESSATLVVTCSSAAMAGAVKASSADARDRRMTPLTSDESQNYSRKGNAPRAPARHELQTPKPLPLPRMAAHRPPMLFSSP